MQLFSRLVSWITTPMRVVIDLMTRYLPLLRRLPRSSGPLQAAVATFLFLLIIVIAAAVRYATGGDAIDDVHWLMWVLASLLVLAIPVVVYYLVKLLSSKSESAYPQIDQIWQAAMQACEQNQINLRRLPIFVVVGSRDINAANSMMEAAHQNLKVKVPGSGQADLAFFASEDAIFVHFIGSSCLSHLSSSARVFEPGGAPDSAGAAGVAPGSTMDADAFARLSDATFGPNAAPGAEKGAAAEEGTLTEGAFAQLEAAGGRGGIPKDSERTMILPDDDYDWDAPLADKQEQVPTARRLSSKEILACEQKMLYVCGLIRKARGTLSPINGVLSLLPFDLVETSSGEVQTAVQRDLKLLHSALMVRCPNIAVVTHMEEVEGFDQLVDRVGEQRARENRFGKGCTLWNVPTRERLESIAIHAVGAYEDWIYTFFQREAAFDATRNGKLFLLLARTRGQFCSRLAEVLAGGFACEQGQQQRQFVFGGCYFAATGFAPQEQAFVKGVVAKAIEQDGEIEWSTEARRQDQRLHLIANVFALIGMVSLMAIIYMLIDTWNG